MLCDGEALGDVGRAERDGTSVGTEEVDGVMLCDGAEVGLIEKDGASITTTSTVKIASFESDLAPAVPCREATTSMLPSSSVHRPNSIISPTTNTSDTAIVTLETIS